MQHVLHKLNRLGLLDERAVTDAARLIDQGEPFEQAVLSVDGLKEDRLLSVLAKEFGVELIDLEGVVPPRELLSRLPAHVLSRRKLLPIDEADGRLRVATSTLCDSSGIDELRVVTGMEIEAVLAPSDQIAKALGKHLGVGAATMQSLMQHGGITVVDEDDEGVDLADDAEDASIIQFVNQVLVEAIERRATDVHFEPFEEKLSVRYRVDGVLQEATLPADVRRFQAAIVSRLKILSHLDIAEKRLPQDGRIKLMVAGREVDVRVSVIPMLYGEAVVLRLLDRSSTLVGLQGLGMEGEDLRGFSKVLGLPHGIVLVTGPTGSGKTTTLYASLAQINDVERKIITIEDPIEYHLEGVNQIQVDTKTGLSFSKGLRAILRHDPDVVLIGEIRDRETADIAVQASLTGHLVFSTLHTNDAPGAITRLIDMGVEPFLVASSLEMVVAQRLVRLICGDCREPITIVDADRVRVEYGSDLPDTLYHGRGCSACGGTGYRGRKGIFELMPITDELRSHITENASSQVIRRTAIAQGMKSLRQDGWRLIQSGLTTVEEVLRVTKDERATGKLLDDSNTGGA
ncbi:MAG: Flp pilus assembly complex ATPase component TadA [Phycisphaeraceae bacterium]|nr:Flp pilus assembly complex ATPase component TadA [Phycisphaeraceae bacterium]